MFVLHSWLCHILFMPCILFEEPFILSPIFFLVYLEKLLQIFFSGWQLKHVGWLLFCLGISKPLSLGTGLILPYMLGLDVWSRPDDVLHKASHAYKVQPSGRQSSWSRQSSIIYEICVHQFNHPDISLQGPDARLSRPDTLQYFGHNFLLKYRIGMKLASLES